MQEITTFGHNHSYKVSDFVLFFNFTVHGSTMELDHSVHFKTEPKNHTENKPNRTDFFVFMVSGFGMV